LKQFQVNLLLEVMEVQKKVTKVLMTNRSKFQVRNIGHICYFAVGAWLSYSVMALANFWAPSVKKLSLYEKGESFENWGRR